jgi:16S rRNA (adenine1518-N6/adenine1519-N6)-dimethyltransferase
MYRPTELRKFLTTLGVHPKKSLSQNFLIDGNIVRKILTFADVKKGETVIEIGPGPGALTEELARIGAQIIAIEKDRIFAKALERIPGVCIRCEDALDVDYAELQGQIVANLPYHITTPFLAKIIPLHRNFSSATLMIQKEVAERILAPPGSKTYGSLSVFVQFYTTPTYGFTVEPTCFYPRPKVKSAVIQLRLHPPPPVTSIDRFFQMTRTAFSMRRKTLRASLKRLYPNASLPQQRPEELSLSDFLTLFEEIEKNRSDIES